jgi:hypothetical protein
MCFLSGWMLMQNGRGSLMAQPPLGEVDVARKANEAVVDPRKLTEFVDQLSGKDARRMLKQMVKSVSADGNAAKKERLAAAILRAMPRVARTPDELLEITGSDCPKTVVRQIFYRHYREQWVFEHPIRCCVVFDCVKGKDPRLLAALLLPNPS